MNQCRTGIEEAYVSRKDQACHLSYFQVEDDRLTVSSSSLGALRYFSERGDLSVKSSAIFQHSIRSSLT